MECSKIVQGDRDKVREVRAHSELSGPPNPFYYFCFPLYHIYCYIKSIFFTLAHSLIVTLIQVEASL